MALISKHRVASRSKFMRSCRVTTTTQPVGLTSGEYSRGALAGKSSRPLRGNVSPQAGSLPSSMVRRRGCTLVVALARDRFPCRGSAVGVQSGAHLGMEQDGFSKYRCHVRHCPTLQASCVKSTAWNAEEQALERGVLRLRAGQKNLHCSQSLALCQNSQKMHAKDGEGSEHHHATARRATLSPRSSSHQHQPRCHQGPCSCPQPARRPE